MKNRNPQPQQGFTLLELMLVIVIITVMMISALRVLQGKLAAMRVQRAAEQIQSYLSAAQDYFVQNGVWPGSGMPLSNNNNETAGTDAETDLIQGGYLTPISSSPWGTPYAMCPQIATNNTPTQAQMIECPPQLPFVGQQANISFFVYFTLPQALSSFGSQVAALLPNGVNSCAQGESKDGMCQIQTQVVGPSEVLNLANYIKNVQVVQAYWYDDRYYQPINAANYGYGSSSQYELARLFRWASPPQRSQ